MRTGADRRQRAGRPADLHLRSRSRASAGGRVWLLSRRLGDLSRGRAGRQPPWPAYHQRDSSGKAHAATANLARAGLADLVEVRVGDALQTLARLGEPVDLLVLDGWNELYLPVLELLTPHLAAGALVLADLSADDPDLASYLARVRDPDGDWTSLTVPFDAGVEISTRATTAS